MAPEKWDDLDDAAEFHTDAYSELGMPQTLSSNELTDTFLTWALDIFWKDKGGKPKKGSPEWKKKVAAFAEELKVLRAQKSDKSR